MPGERPLNTSQFPLGYGVYFLPVELTPTETVDHQGGQHHPFRGTRSGCAPVDPAVEYAYLYGEEEGAMYLFTQQQGTLSLTVLDETGAAVQTFPVLEDLEEDRLSSVRFREGYLLAESIRDRFRVVETAGGTCRAALEGSLRAVWGGGDVVSGIR